MPKIYHLTGGGESDDDPGPPDAADAKPAASKRANRKKQVSPLENPRTRTLVTAALCIVVLTAMAFIAMHFIPRGGRDSEPMTPKSGPVSASMLQPPKGSSPIKTPGRQPTYRRPQGAAAGFTPAQGDSENREAPQPGIH